MTGRHGYEGRPERQNEYFIPGDGISREVIQADICRYLGNDALVRPGNHNVCFPVSPILEPTKQFKSVKTYFTICSPTDSLRTGSPGLLHPCLSKSDFCMSKANPLRSPNLWKAPRKEEIDGFRLTVALRR